MASEPTPETLIETLMREASLLEMKYNGLAATAPIAASSYLERASRLREAAGRLWEALAEGDEKAAKPWSRGRTKALVERINGGPLVTSGADPGPKGEACEGWCGCDWSLIPVGVKHWAGGHLSNSCFCSPACRDAGRPLHPAAFPATGMEPGQRCTRVSHADENHRNNLPGEVNWAGPWAHLDDRCPYIEPTPTPEKK